MPVQGTSEERPSELPSAGLIRPIKRRIVTDAVFLGPWDGTLRYLSDFRQRRSSLRADARDSRRTLGARPQGDNGASLDGRVADDPAWEMVPPLTDFWQTAPEAGQPASERTEVRIAYTEDALYFGVTLYDRSAEGLTLSDSRRDSPLDDVDSFRILLDTYKDRQNGFVFATNPAALEYDGQVIGEGGMNLGGG